MQHLLLGKEHKTLDEKTGFDYVGQSIRLHHILSDPSSNDGIDFFPDNLLRNILCLKEILTSRRNMSNRVSTLIIFTLHSDFQ